MEKQPNYILFIMSQDSTWIILDYPNADPSQSTWWGMFSGFKSITGI